MRRRVLAVLAVAMLAACAPPITAPLSGFKPTSPVQKFDTNSNQLVILTVPTRRPTLAWAPFPGERQSYALMPKSPFIDVDPARVTEVSYDLRIWRSAGGAPGELVYERQGLPEPVHRVEEELPRAQVMFWSVRARFRVDGELRLSEWSLSNLPHYGMTARDAARQSGTIPPRNYYRFRTPGR